MIKEYLNKESKLVSVLLCHLDLNTGVTLYGGIVNIELTSLRRILYAPY